MDSTLRKWFDRLTELQNMIDREAEAARSGCVRSQQIIIDAEREQEQLQHDIDAHGINGCLVWWRKASRGCPILSMG